MKVAVPDSEYVPTAKPQMVRLQLPSPPHISADDRLKVNDVAPDISMNTDLRLLAASDKTAYKQVLDVSPCHNIDVEPPVALSEVMCMVCDGGGNESEGKGGNIGDGGDE